MRLVTSLALSLAFPDAALAAEPAQAAPAEDAADRLVLVGILEALADEAVVDTELPADPRRVLAEELDRIEGDLLQFGFFPNSAGFLDGRLYARKRYLDFFSSGLWFDYSTLRTELDAVDRQRDLVSREFRADLDLVKGLLPVHDWLSDAGDAPRTALWSVEIGLNAKLIYDREESAGYRSVAGGATVFDQEDKDIARAGGGLKVESSFALGRHFACDLIFEYLPLLYSHERAEKRTSQFPDEPIDYTIENTTTGLQGTVALTLRDLPVGRFQLRGRAFRNTGEVATRSTVVTGNFATRTSTLGEVTEDDLWLELSHGMTYLRPYALVVPVIAVGVQRNRVETVAGARTADTYKIGLLAEFH